MLLRKSPAATGVTKTLLTWFCSICVYTDVAITDSATLLGGAYCCCCCTDSPQAERGVRCYATATNMGSHLVRATQLHASRHLTILLLYTQHAVFTSDSIIIKRSGTSSSAVYVQIFLLSTMLQAMRNC
jgi:hypothetical protein